MTEEGHLVCNHTKNHKDLSNASSEEIAKNLKALDVLPYHTMGVGKYKEMGIPYPLEGLPPLPVDEAIKAKEYILEGIRQTRVKK